MPKEQPGQMPKQSPEISTEGQERKKQLETLAQIAIEHPEVLDVPFSPKMFASFAQHLKTPSGDIFIVYQILQASVSANDGFGQRAGKILQLYSDKPKLTKEAFIDQASQPLMNSAVWGARPELGFGGLETLPSDTEYSTEYAVDELSRNMELISTEEAENIKDGVQIFLYTFRPRAKK